MLRRIVMSLYILPDSVEEDSNEPVLPDSVEEDGNEPVHITL